MAVAYFWSLDPQFFGLAVDTSASGALSVNGLVERAGTVEGDALNASLFPIDIFDTALSFGELFVVTCFTCFAWKE
jgi:hypothetical protein